jgi:long-subunit fatty acid transport protein
MELGNFNLGLTRYHSGAIQLDGQGSNLEGCNPATAAIALCSVIPSADVTIYSTAYLARYSINENISVFAGLNQFSLGDSEVTTIGGHYKVASKSENVTVYGAAYEIPDIALRVEAIFQEETSTSLAASSSLSPLLPTTPLTGASYTIPETVTLNFQSGIAEDTLIFGSIHQQSWDTAQIVIPGNANGINPVTFAADTPVSAVSSSFSDKTAYSIGVGRKMSDKLSLSISYSKEDGSGPTTDDPFTLSDGSQGITIGARYSLENNITISGGYNYTTAGDVKVIHEVAPGVPSGLTADYKDNSTSAIGVRLAFNF